MRRKRLINTETIESIPLHEVLVNYVHGCFPASSLQNKIFRDFKEVFVPELKHPHPGAMAKHGVEHHIKTSGPPVYSKYRRLNKEKYEQAKAAFKEMEKMRVCPRAPSQWASILHMVKKADGTWRPCGDYRRLNLVIDPDHYPMPNIHDFTSYMGNASIYSKLDLLKGYFQVPVHASDVHKTAIITPFGSYVFHYSTFGLRNSGATFQPMMDQFFGDTLCCLVYVDDILVFQRLKSNMRRN